MIGGYVTLGEVGGVVDIHYVAEGIQAVEITG